MPERNSHEGPDRVLQHRPKTTKQLRLVVDGKNTVALADKPIFGLSVTINEALKNNIGCLLMPGFIVGWVNYLDINSFACISVDNIYSEAGQFVHADKNKLLLKKPIKLVAVEEDMNESKHLLTFDDIGNARNDELS